MKTELNIPDADAFHEALACAHEGLSEHQSHVFHAGLALLLANQIGDQTILYECIAAARGSVLDNPPTNEVIP